MCDWFLSSHLGIMCVCGCGVDGSVCQVNVGPRSLKLWFLLWLIFFSLSTSYRLCHRRCTPCWMASIKHWNRYLFSHTLLWAEEFSGKGRYSLICVSCFCASSVQEVWPRKRLSSFCATIRARLSNWQLNCGLKMVHTTPFGYTQVTGFITHLKVIYEKALRNEPGRKNHSPVSQPNLNLKRSP